MTDNYLEDAELSSQIPKGVSRIVDQSREMDSIRKAIEGKGLDPIWAKLIAEFGALMYRRGQDEGLDRRVG